MIDKQSELFCGKCGKNDYKVTGTRDGDGITLICECGHKIVLSGYSGDYGGLILVSEGLHRWEFQQEIEKGLSEHNPSWVS